ncbi:membrane-associated protein, putative [Bodo saltans]|uniref:Membrane-associated protein, putative n=1 Tax=Bodo saltans TaxID=75058 RepID=A0A0S4KHN4_BODSA|nr:membrane-associated protein, putative [Bodo saltans]|eukprot:CUI11839.1 membrane-associated protein, putative [Bodo saltans]
MQKRNRGPHGDTPPVLRTPLMPSPLNISSRGLSLSSSNIPKTRSQLSGLAGLMACSVFAIVTLSILHGYRAENTYASTHAFSHHYETNPRYLANRYEVQPRQSFRQASSVSELDELLLVSRESNSSSIQSRLDAPCPHRSQVFPRAQDEPVDSVVVVSFDVFRTPRASGAVDPAESELEGIVRDIVASSTFNETEKRQMVRNAALWFVGRAMLSRPSGFDQPKRQANSGATHTDVVMSEYLSFFIGRNTSAWTYHTSSHDATATIPPRPLCTRPTVQERYPIGVPVTMDVVYTHVADDARSQREFRKRFPQAFRGSVQRFRDWNELKFSTRSVFHYSICDDPKSLCYFEDEHGMHPNAVVRNIYIVVADTDQVPAYINTSHPRVHIVEHKTLFGMSDEGHSLPTFNSHAIESVLHRIPGLSRFYVYFNNDMLWGRQLSFFDYFRPLAEPRFGMRYSLLEAQLADKGPQCAHPAKDDAELRDFMDNDGVVDLRRLRVTMMFEPLMHFENTENGKDMKFERKRYVDPSVTTAAPSSSKRSLRHEPLFPSAKKNNTTNTTASSPPAETSPQQPEISSSVASMYRVRNCSAQGVERMEDLQFHDFSALFLLSNGRRASVISERFRTFVSNNKNYAFEVFGVAGWHSHSYSHSPHLYDRDIMTAMLEKDFFRAAKATRKSQLRHGSNLWTTMVANSYHTMHRKVLDWELMDGKRVALLWEGTAGALTNGLNGGGGGRHQHHRNRGVSLEEESPTSYAKYIAVPLLASANVRDDIRSASYNISVDDILSPYWKDARNNAAFGVESHRYSHTMWRAIEYLLMIAAASGDKRNQALKHFHAEAVEPQFRALLDDASGISQEKLCSHFLGRDADENAVLPLLIAPPRVFVRRGGNNKNARETHGGLRSYAIAEDCNRALQKKAHWSITELEKLDHHIVKLDQKAGMYHFCMMNTLRATKRYTEELSRETKLFVAANDDFPVRLPGGTEESVRNLLSTASGSVPAAGWEVWWKHYDEI